MIFAKFRGFAAYAVFALSVLPVVAYGDAAAPSQFSSTATPSPASVDPGAVSTISYSLTDSGSPVSGANVDIEVYDSAGKKAGQRVVSDQSWNTGDTHKYSYDWTTPTAPGGYKVTLVVTSADWSKQYYSLYPAASITVKGDVAPTKVPFTLTAAVLPNTVPSGKPIKISCALTDTGSPVSNALIVVQINDPSKQVDQKIFSNQSWDANSTQKVSFDWTAPATAGSYSVTVLVEDPTWTNQYYSNWPAARFTVTSP